MSGERTNSAAYQKALRDREAVLEGRRRADLERLLKADWGRRFFYRLTHELGRAMAPSYEPRIEDGVARAIAMGRNEGIRELALLLVAEAQEHCPDLWNQMIGEALAESNQELERRRMAAERQEQPE